MRFGYRPVINPWLLSPVSAANCLKNFPLLLLREGTRPGGRFLVLWSTPDPHPASAESIAVTLKEELWARTLQRSVAKDLQISWIIFNYCGKVPIVKENLKKKKYPQWLGDLFIPPSLGNLFWLQLFQKTRLHTREAQRWRKGNLSPAETRASSAPCLKARARFPWHTNETLLAVYTGAELN